MAGQQRGHHVGVVGGLGQPTCGVHRVDNLGRQLRSVGEVAVVPECDATAMRGRTVRRLCVLPRARPGGRVAAVADGKVTLQRGQCRLVEDLRDQAELFVDHDRRAVGNRHPRGLLAAVLQGVKAEVRQLRDVLTRGPHTEDTTGVLRGLLVRVECVVGDLWSARRARLQCDRRRASRSASILPARHSERPLRGAPLRDYHGSRGVNDMTTALVVYGSERGGTAGLAEMIAAELRKQGWEATSQDAAQPADLSTADVVVIGGALYMNRWHKAARAFVRRHAKVLELLPVYLFSSGPLDDSAREGDIAAVPQVKAIARRIDARASMTFGGR